MGSLIAQEKNYTTIQYSYTLGKSGPVKYYTIQGRKYLPGILLKDKAEFSIVSFRRSSHEERQKNL